MKTVFYSKYSCLNVSALASCLSLLLLTGCISNKSIAPQTANNNTDPIIEITHPTQESRPQYVARLHTELASGYYSRKQYQVALEEINEALKAYREYGPAYGMMALIHARLGDFKGAENAFYQAIQVSPNDPDIRNNFGAFLCERQRFRESLIQFDYALRNPLYLTPQIALQNAAECAYKGGEIPQAKHYYQQLGREMPAITPSAPLITPSVTPPASPIPSKSTQSTAPSSQQNSTIEQSDLLQKGRSAYEGGDLITAQTHIQKALQDTSSPSPALLHLALCIERRFANEEGEEKYADLLLSQHGRSYEALSLNTSDRGCS